ncbi:response regulator [bacterium]|nr:response regulator [bacterium]
MVSILLVDDHPGLLEIMVLALEDDYQIVTARDGQEGLEKAGDHNPDLIIADYAMPEMNGLEMVKQIRRLPDNKSLIILVSAYLSQEVKHQAKALGVIECIAKPCDIVYLRNKIEAILKKHKHSTSDSEPPAGN